MTSKYFDKGYESHELFATHHSAVPKFVSDKLVGRNQLIEPCPADRERSSALFDAVKKFHHPVLLFITSVKEAGFGRCRYGASAKKASASATLGNKASTKEICKRSSCQITDAYKDAKRLKNTNVAFSQSGHGSGHQKPKVCE